MVRRVAPPPPKKQWTFRPRGTDTKGMIRPALQLGVTEDIPGVLRLLRQAAGFTRDQAAAKMRICPRTLQAWECGERPPRPSMMILLTYTYRNGRQAQNRRVERAYQRGLADRSVPTDH